MRQSTRSATNNFNVSFLLLNFPACIIRPLTLFIQINSFGREREPNKLFKFETRVTKYSSICWAVISDELLKLPIILIQNSNQANSTYHRYLIINLIHENITCCLRKLLGFIESENTKNSLMNTLQFLLLFRLHLHFVSVK